MNHDVKCKACNDTGRLVFRGWCDACPHCSGEEDTSLLRVSRDHWKAEAQRMQEVFDRLRLSSRTRVRARYPDAYAYKWADSWTIYAASAGNLQGICLGDGKTAALAWQNAAKTHC